MSRSAKLRTARAVLVVLLGAAGGAASAAAQHQGHRSGRPLVLKEQGSFYVGGERREIEFSFGVFGGLRPGTIWANGMYVQYMIPPKAKKRLPVVMWSGGCHTGKSFETTPDGREGWQTIFVRRGFPVYVVDATWRGRSPISQNDIQGVRVGALPPDTLPAMLTCDEELAAPPVGGFRLRNSNFPIEALDQYLAQLVPDFFFSEQNGPPPNVAALIALLEKIGPAVVLAHSQGGLTAYPTVIQRPDLVRAYVAVEALGSCTAITDDYPDDVPTLVMSGDPIHPSVPPPFGIEGCKTVAESHPNMTVLYLPEEGVFGNSHMMMMDRNNVQIADIIIDWIEEHAGRRRR